MPEYDVDRLKALPIRVVIEREIGKEFIKRGSKLFTNCPFHIDPGPSLSIDEDENVWFCHGGGCGMGGDVIRFIELKRGVDFQEACKYLVEHYDNAAVIDANAKPQGKGTGKGRKSPPIMPIPEGALFNGLDKALKTEWWIKHYGDVKAAWRYHDVNGGVAYCDVRFEKDVKGQLKKQVLPMYFARTNTWKMGIPFEILKKPRILYNLHLLAANPDKPVLVVEGCKCASVDVPGLRDRFILTTWPGGTNGIPKVDMRPLFNRKVIIWPDNDQASKKFEFGGYKAAYHLAARLEGKSDITVLRASEHPGDKKTKHGYDIVDYIEDGGDVIEYIGNISNHLTIQETKELSGLIEPDADEAPDFRDFKKFTNLSTFDASAVLNVLNALATNKEGNITKSDGNFLHIVEHDPGFRYLVAYDTATNDVRYSDVYSEIDELDNKIWQYSQKHYSIAPTKTQRTDMLKTIAYRNSFNSLEVFFDQIKEELFGDNDPVFDENPLHEFLGHVRFAIEDQYREYDEVEKHYTELFHQYFLRMFIKLEYIMQGNIDMIPPGDIVPILEGDQGIGKTRLCLLLSIEPQKYYVDMAELQLTTSRDTLAKIKGKLIGELGELAGLKRTELEAIKAFISATFDEMRRLYSENTVRSPRTISFIGTTNEREYLRDTTGNRRFWPVRLQYVDSDLYGKKDLIKLLYIYYRQEARKSIAGNTVSRDLYISHDLFEFTQYLREEKRVKPVYLEFIMNYIEKTEEKALTDDPVKISLKLAAVQMLNYPEEDMLQKYPPKFEAEFTRILKERGYIQARGIFNGRQRRYWQLEGRYCPKCCRVVDHVVKYTIEDKEYKACDDCMKKEKETIDEPF